VVEPTGLTVVRALATYLEGKPLAAEVLLLEGVIAEDMLGVVLFDNVLDDGARFPQSKACIWVLNCRSSAVWIDFMYMFEISINLMRNLSSNVAYCR
jgi:hypothetical protein